MHARSCNEVLLDLHEAPGPGFPFPMKDIIVNALAVVGAIHLTLDIVVIAFLVSIIRDENKAIELARRYREEAGTETRPFAS